MTHDAQVGDTVRLTIVVEGVVVDNDGLEVRGYELQLGPNRTVEILHRATPPLPKEPGYYLTESEAKIQGVLQLTESRIWWWVGNKNRPNPEMLTHDEAWTYGHLRRLTVSA